MRLAETLACLFWLTLSLALGAGSYKLGLGTPQEPEPGFLPFWTAVFLGILTVVLFIRTVYPSHQRPSLEPFAWGKHWKRLITVIVTLILYAATLSVLGYVLSTFLLLVVLFSLYGRWKWWWVVGASLAAVGATVLIFSFWLAIQLPTGIWGI